MPRGGHDEVNALVASNRNSRMSRLRVECRRMWSAGVNVPRIAARLNMPILFVEASLFTRVKP